ncbi:MAG: InlB B-repeat-containing protein [Candidatus Izemoplasmatales bacterium]|nr:InlB B-repeat-containing protein [Candidatus Izemoplasmatales bacterium]
MKKLLFIFNVLILIVLGGCSEFTTNSQGEQGVTNDYEYEISFDSNGGNSIHSIYVFDGESIVLPTPTKKGYDFIGWFDNAELTNLVTNDTLQDQNKKKDMILYAKWEAKTYEISYELNGGKLPLNQPTEYSYGDVPIISDPYISNNIFSGWFLDEDFTTPYITSTFSFDKDILLYAKWKWKDIGTLEEFQNIEINLDGSYRLKSDIDFLGLNNNYLNEFHPIGSETNPFTGEFDGNGYVLKNFEIYETIDSSIGVFAYVKDAEIHNLLIENVLILSNKTKYGGILAGYVENSNISKIGILSSEISISNDSAYYPVQVGGIIGLGNQGQLSKSFVADTSVSGIGAANYSNSKVIVGGIIGVNNMTILQTYSWGRFDSNAPSRAVEVYMGGIAGINEGQIAESYSSATLTGRSATIYIGGLVAKNTGIIRNSFSATELLLKLDETLTMMDEYKLGSTVVFQQGILSNVYYRYEQLSNPYYNPYLTSHNEGTKFEGSSWDNIEFLSMELNWHIEDWVIVEGYYPGLKYE